jgi:hypothetical protein
MTRADETSAGLSGFLTDLHADVFFVEPSVLRFFDAVTLVSDLEASLSQSSVSELLSSSSSAASESDDDVVDDNGNLACLEGPT